eukprot:scaffold10329_cov66-Cyclotella_meneghiniana.AAC.9
MDGSNKIDTSNNTIATLSANARSSSTIARLKIYNNGKAIRNKGGKMVGGYRQPIQEETQQSTSTCNNQSSEYPTTYNNYLPEPDQ